MPQPGLGCVTLHHGGLTDSGFVVDDEKAVGAIDVMPRRADKGPAKLPESGPSGGIRVIGFGGDACWAPPGVLGSFAAAKDE